MATQLQQISKNLYETDYVQWLEKNVNFLKEGKINLVDYEHLIEELEDLGREQRHKVESYLRQLLKHLLLYQYWDSQKLYCASGWADEIDNFRAELEILLRSRTLFNYFESIIESTYQKARKSAIKKSQLTIFPQSCPYTIEQILDIDWLP